MPVTLTWRAATITAAALLGATALGVTAVSAATSPAATPNTQVSSAPLPGFHDGYADNGKVRVHYVTGGHGPALVLLHGWPETWYGWSDLMPALAKTHTVVAVDLRGLGDSTPAPTDAGQYTPLTLATDVHAVVTHLGLDRSGPIDLAGHDWGGQIALAYAAEYRTGVHRLAILEAPAPSAYLDLVKTRPGTFWFDWFVNGSAPGTAERLVDSDPAAFYQQFWANANGAISATAQRHYLASFGRPSGTHAGFELFRQQDVGVPQTEALIAKQGKLTIPTIGIGGANSMGTLVGTSLGADVANVTTAVVPNANHWVLEEQPGYVLNLLIPFFAH